MDTNNNNKQCECNKSKVVNDLLKRISNLEFEVESKEKENERLNNIIKRLETDLYNMYITFGEFSEEYTENCIKKLKGVDEE